MKKIINKASQIFASLFLIFFFILKPRNIVPDRAKYAHKNTCEFKKLIGLDLEKLIFDESPMRRPEVTFRIERAQSIK